VGYAGLAVLGPFAIEDQLMSVASRHAERMMSNACSGNPNFLLVPRQVFVQLLPFTGEESERSYLPTPGAVGVRTDDQGLQSRFNWSVESNQSAPGVSLLRAGVSYVRDQLGLSAAAFLDQLNSEILAFSYSSPPRISPITERVGPHYRRRDVMGGEAPSGEPEP
jgi:aspartate 4-decarboxylase